MKIMKFFMRDSRSNCGSNVFFWCLGGGGYVTDLSKAEQYTLEDAQRQHDSRITDIPLSVDEVLKYAVNHVDMQYLPDSDNIWSNFNPNNEFVIQILNEYNGNDILFVTRGNGYSYDYNDAYVCDLDTAKSLSENDNSRKIWSKNDLDKIYRSTFQANHISTREFITKYGIKFNRPKRIRETTGKTRHNCPVCGKLVWDYNPYDAPICSDECQINYDKIGWRF